MDDLILRVVIIFIVIIIIFLIIREFWAWYWKINLILEQLKDQNKFLSKILDRLSSDNIYEEGKDKDRSNDDDKIEEEKNKKKRKSFKELIEDEEQKLKSKK